MKWDCGPTEEEREILERQWRRHFAWIPIRVGSHDCRWMETVERRRPRISDGIPERGIEPSYSWHRWEYRPIGGDA